jgi:DNA modification methylase
VLDPFNGSGTTTVAAALLGRKYVGIDQSEEYIGYARKRLEHALAGAPKNGADVTKVITDVNRASRVRTETDAFGRARVERRRAAKSA